jgi:hypothetical protein
MGWCDPHSTVAWSSDLVGLSASTTTSKGWHVATIHYGGDQLPLTFTNHFLAHLQMAVHQRFGQERGFFLTGTVSDADGVERTCSHWFHPGVPLAFTYDVVDDAGSRVPPIKLDHNEIDVILEAMGRPEGVRSTDSLWLPFAEDL